MVTGCLFLVMLAFLLSICTFLTWQNCCKGRYQRKKTLQPDTAIAELRFSKIRVTIVRQLSKTGWSHLLPLWDDPAPGHLTVYYQAELICPKIYNITIVLKLIYHMGYIHQNRNLPQLTDVKLYVFGH